MQLSGYVTDLLNERAVAFVTRATQRPFALFLAHKAVHPDVQQKQDGTLDLATMGGYVLRRASCATSTRAAPIRPAERAADRGGAAPEARVARSVRAAQDRPESRPFLEGLASGTQEEIRRRAAMMASVDEGVGALLEALEDERFSTTR